MLSFFCIYRRGFMEDKGYHYILDVILSDINFLKNDKLLETFFLKVLSKTKFNTIGFYRINLLQKEKA